MHEDVLVYKVYVGDESYILFFNLIFCYKKYEILNFRKSSGNFQV